MGCNFKSCKRDAEFLAWLIDVDVHVIKAYLEVDFPAHLVFRAQIRLDKLGIRTLAEARAAFERVKRG